jgi:LPS export ABC transporter protein LptC
MACFLRKFVPFFVLPTALVLTHCAKIEEEPPWEHRERPMMLFTDTTILDLYEGNKLSWKLKTAYLERWEGTERVFARPILVDIYDSTGAKVAFLRADSGSLDTKMSYVNAYGRVYALSPQGASVRADSLVWNKRDNNVRTDSPVRVVSEDGDVLQGIGFFSDARLENWQIRSNVTAIFQDAARRLKEEDEKQNKAAFADSTATSSSRGTSASSSSVAAVARPAPPPPPPPPARPASSSRRLAPMIPGRAGGHP